MAKENKKENEYYMDNLPYVLAPSPPPPLPMDINASIALRPPLLPPIVPLSPILSPKHQAVIENFYECEAEIYEQVYYNPDADIKI